MVTDSKPIDRTRVDKQIGIAEKTAQASESTQVEEFAVLLRVRGTKRTGQQSVESDLLDFVIPDISDPAVFNSLRCIGLLEHLVSDIIPNLDESEDLRHMAAAMLKEEIERQRDLHSRRNEAIAA